MADIMNAAILQYDRWRGHGAQGETQSLQYIQVWLLLQHLRSLCQSTPLPLSVQLPTAHRRMACATPLI